MCLMSAPAAKKPGMREVTTTTLTPGSPSANSSAAFRPSTIGRPSALAGGRSSTMQRTPSAGASQPTAGTVASAIGPAHRAGHQDVAAERAPEDLLDVAAGGKQLLDVDAGLVAHLMQHREQVLGGDVAGRAGRHGAAAELAEARLEAADARVERRQHVGEPLATRVVEVRGELDPGQPLLGGEEKLADLAGVRHAGGVAEPKLVRAGGGDSLGQVEHAARVDVAVVGAAEGDGDHAFAVEPGVEDAREHALDRRERVVDGAVDVLAVVRLRRTEEDADLVKAIAVIECLLEAALVGDEDAEGDVVGDVDALQHLGGVGELREHVGAHEARDLDAAQPGARERVHEPDLVLGADLVGLVLEPVARPDLADLDLLLRCHAGKRSGHVNDRLLSTACSDLSSGPSTRPCARRGATSSTARSPRSTTTG